VRGNGKIIQELETIFLGAQWNVVKVVWGGDWDDLLASDTEGLLVKRMGEVVDGQYQKYSVETGDYFRKDFFGVSQSLLKMVEHLTDEQLHSLKRGGHDRKKVYAAFKAAAEFKGAPSVILAKTVKGYGLGESGEGKNITHQEKKLSEDELKRFRTRFNIPIPDEEVGKTPFYRPSDDSPEIKYLKQRRAALGGPVPLRRHKAVPCELPGDEIFKEFFEGTKERAVSTTMVYVKILAKLIRDAGIGKYIVPIVPDEARTFGMDALFREIGIYSHVGQRYDPVDKENLLYYRESTNGQILEEGITEAGSMAAFISAGTAYAAQGIHTIPFYTFYSMFGFQRMGDLVWAAADMCCRGFLVGGTSGRTTLNGEGLQHQDGHSHLLFSCVPSCVTYDPAFAYELAVIIREGLRRMYRQNEDVFYYITVANENYAMPPMPEGVEDGIVKGMYKFMPAGVKNAVASVNLLGSGALLNEAIKAKKILEESYNVAAPVFSVTSYNELRREALAAERFNMLNPLKELRVPYITQCLKEGASVSVAVSDYLKALPDSVSKWVKGRLVSLGTDGFGRSGTREDLRDFFEVSSGHIVFAALSALMRDGKIGKDIVAKAAKELNIEPLKSDPARN